MLKHPQPGARRRRIGALAVCAMLAGSSYGAWALRPSESVVAPSWQGRIEQEAVAIASVRIPKGMSVEVSGASMFTAQDEAVHLPLNPRMDISITSFESGDEWSVRVRGAGTAEAPRITWTLSREGLVERETDFLLSDGVATPVDLSMLADSSGRAPELSIRRLPVDRVVDSGGVDRPVAGMTRDGDGIYRQLEPLRTYSREFRGDGSATLLVGVGSDGRVHSVDLEQVTPGGAFTAADADRLVRNNAYAPEHVDGKPVPTRIRIPVEFGREVPPALAAPSSPTMPAPPYPAEAAAANQGGRVVLKLLVAVDGSVKDVVVEESEPAGVFDAATVEAAKQWTLAPQVEDGKAVEGWVRVPVDFRPDDDTAAAAAAPQG